MKHFFSSNKKIHELHIKGYFMARNAFVAEVTFNVIFTALQKLNNVTYFTLQTVSIAF